MISINVIKNVPYGANKIDAIVNTHMDEHDIILALNVIEPVSRNLLVGGPKNLFSVTTL